MSISVLLKMLFEFLTVYKESISLFKVWAKVTIILFILCIIVVSVLTCTSCFGVLDDCLDTYQGLFYCALILITLIVFVLKMVHKQLQWDRVLVHADAEECRKMLVKIKPLLESTYKKVVAECFAQTGFNYTPEQIRINIFLPYLEEKNLGQICVLKIPAHFHIHMTHHGDRSIEFRPLEGCTGRSFSYNCILGSYRQKTNIYQWNKLYCEKGDHERVEPTFNISQDQNRLINSHLEWVMSFPLIPKKGEKAVGVFNIDGLTLQNQTNEEVLRNLMISFRDQLTLSVAEMADLIFASLPKSKIIISRRDL